ncbi:putative RNA-binding protein Luc7-like 2-like, partial [Trifolium medium]|nr:putative RNA-binding protein Luc7-like 2-like [Trifolium medium]
MVTEAEMLEKKNMGKTEDKSTLEVLELFQEIKEKLKEADKNDLEGMLNMKIQDLEIVEELIIKRVYKHEIVKYEDLEIVISSENVVQVFGSVNMTL